MSERTLARAHDALWIILLLALPALAVAKEIGLV